MVRLIHKADFFRSTDMVHTKLNGGKTLRQIGTFNPDRIDFARLVGWLR